MFSQRITLCAASIVLYFSPFALAQDTTQPAQVTVDAKLERISQTEADLVVTATISPGLHIYAQTQSKPFLATTFNVEPSSEVVSVGHFVTLQQPILLRHESLGVELREHEGAVQWRAKVILTKNAGPNIVVHGSVFAQACESNLCYAPETYPFVARQTDIGSAARTAPLSQLRDVSDDSVLESGASAQYQGSQDFDLANLKVVATQTQSAWNVLPLAFVAGFLLNLMPCVLPVVGLKILSFVQQANTDRKRILMMNLSYTAGLLSVMMILATLAVFAGLGWGEQFSSAGFTITLSVVVFAFGLSFLGVWEIPLPGIVGRASSKATQEGYAGAFSKGILSTLLATPCSGPFLGAALAWAVTQPSYLTYSAFAAVGLGMASPYLVIGMFPSMIRILPKPGHWMIKFKQVMGFVMLTTVVYLMSFMPVAAVVPTVLLLLGIGIALWFAGQTSAYARILLQVKAWSVASLIVAASVFVSFGWLQTVMQTRFERAAERLLSRNSAGPTLDSVTSHESGKIQWEAYSPERLEELARAGKPVFVDFTADWCLTCKANEATAIETSEVADALRAGRVVALRADKTEPNAQADLLLRKLGNSAASIPFYAFFPAGKPNEPILLDGVFASPEPFVSAIWSAASEQHDDLNPSAVRISESNGRAQTAKTAKGA